MVGWPDRRWLDLSKTEQPIVQAPMAGGGAVELCIAAIGGGALGSLPCGMLSPEQVREQVAAVRAQTSGPFALNFFCHSMPSEIDDRAWCELLRPYYAEFGVEPGNGGALRLPFDDDMSRVVEEVRPEVVSFHFGLPEEQLLDWVKRTGAVIVGNATTVEEARWLEERGADAIIAQGFEAGGHTGRFLRSDPAEAMGLFALLPQVADAVSVPVIAAGGICDGRGIAAALTLGASGVQVGSAYLHCPESLLTDGQRTMLRERATLFTNIYSGGLARAVRGRLVDEIGAIRSDAPPYPLAGAVTMPLYRAAVQRGDVELLPNLAGQSAARGTPLPAAELTRKLAADALAMRSPRA